MKTSFIPSLQHLCCTKIISLFFNEVLPLIEVYCLRTSKLLENDISLLYMYPEKIYNKIDFEITHKIKCLTPCIPLQKKLRNFIEPLFCEIEEWIKICRESWSCYNDTLLTVLENVPRSWHYDGTIDRERAAKLLVKNSNISPAYRFVLGCTFCFLDEVLEIWKIMPAMDKVFLKRDGDAIVKHWIQWLDSKSDKDWHSFIAWISVSPFWNRNVYVLKHVLKTLSPAEKSVCLKNVLTAREVSSDIMYFGLSLITKPEQELIFSESPVEVFKCITAWPMRSSFFDIEHILRPYLTEDSFYDILNMLLLQIKEQQRSDDLLVILKKFWAQSPCHFKDFAYNNSCIHEPLKFVLEYDFIETFPKDRFALCFYDEWESEFDATFLL